MIIQRSAVVLFSEEQMFKLVNDIERYPEFLPWCRSARILQSTGQTIEASLEIAWSGIHKSFTTQNTLEPNKNIRMILVNGPFRQFAGMWSFEPLEKSKCRVTLDLEFEVLGHWTGRLFQPIFHRIADSLVDAFCQRAQKLYGKTLP